MESYRKSSARVSESSRNREDRLQRRRERERARRASETAEQREERLRVRRARDRATRAAQTAEERDARLRQIRDNRRHSLATESEEERAVRLHRMWDRLASETEEERAVADLGGVRGVQMHPPLVPSNVFCVHNCTSPSNDYAAVACISNNQAQLHTHVSVPY